ncbi:AAA family ATPase [Frondihabitans australicus]|uniref:Nuclease SbcCD subunit C n=1 Tax=Frondihabitans australicus TaxID=386892 RepID=A0A495IJT1_9MICO|nr:SMC family ATPase [Frondihabitans australicus]RKR76223.1 exonuclease SbcC [Frondihabitans australicus]
MQLHRLTLCAIGPYAGEHTIEFAELGASGVFLLDGPTGSGKSTIIDAIVFGLYGQLAGSTSATSKDRLHSHHASAATEPFVEIVFSTGSGIYRVRRAPAWQRPKARGVGTTLQNEKVVLERLTSPDAVTGEPVSSSTQEVGHEMPGIVGLTREQFTQTVVLPQGEFAQFLGASGENRKAVLQSLFGTRIYDDTTAVLVELRRAAHNEIGAAQKAVDEALAGLRTAADDDELAADGAEDVVATFTAESTAAAARRDAARKTREAAETRAAAERALAAAIARRTSLLSRRAELEAAGQEVEGVRLRVEEAGRAATVRPTRVALDSAERALAVAEGAVAEGEGAAPALAALEPAALEARRDDLLREIGSLAGVIEVEAGLEARSSGLETATARLAEARAEADADSEALGRRGEEHEALAARLASAAALAAGGALAEQRVVDAAAARDAAVELVNLDESLRQTTDEVTGAARLAASAVEAETGLRQRRILGMAGEIATTLVDGEACAVCGSTEHPSPAVLTADHPTDDDIAEAESARQEAEAVLASKRDKLTTLTAHRDGLAARVGPLTPEAAQGALDAAVVTARSSREADAEAESLRELVDSFDATTRQLQEALQALRVRLAADGERLDADERALHADRARVATALDGRAESCGALAATLGADEGAVSRLIVARQRRDAAADDVASRRAEFDEALRAAGFETAEALDAAALPADELEALRSRVQDHDRETDLVASQLAADDIAALTGDETADVPAAELALADAREEFDALAGEASVAADRASRAGRALAILRSALAAAAEASSRARAVVRMADVASASGPENVTGVTLGTYVLLRRFEEVLAAANVRLGVMSSGRYRLESSDVREKGSGSRRTGLALTIRDNATDTTRDPKSFSGGETFYASLSLALGLADVVQAEAGGIDLGTLFVDEGFGTLDPETLDAVMSELGRLSAGGRTVGIVSHVDELKQRIADRIEVRRLPDGSSTLRTTVG